MADLNRIKSFKVSHDKGETSVVIYDSQSGAYLGIVVYQTSHLASGLCTLQVDVKHFVGASEDDALAKSLKWVEDYIAKSFTLHEYVP